MIGYKPLAGKGEDTNHWRGKEKKQVIGRERRVQIIDRGRKNTGHRQGKERILTLGEDTHRGHRKEGTS